MKNFLTLLTTATSLLASTRAVVVLLYENADCTGSVTERNVWDNTCAYTSGFQSLKMTTHGGALQHLVAYSPQACAGSQTWSGCVAGIDSIPVGKCFRTTNGNGGSNALSSYSSGGVCPN